MSATTADAKKRVVIPAAKPGEVFDVQKKDEGRFLLVRLERPEPVTHKKHKDCLRAIVHAPLRLRMGWEELRGITREL